MVVELVLTTLVTQAVSHYAGQGFGWFDRQVAETAERAARGDKDAKHDVAVHLAERLQALPRTGPDELNGASVPRAATREGMVADILFDPPPRDPGRYDFGAEPLSPRMEKFMATLDGTFRAVHAFPRSVTAVPGWFHTEYCVAVLDCRSRNGMWHPEAPVQWPPDGSGPFFTFEDVDGRPGSLPMLAQAQTGAPRVSIIECEDLDERAAVLERVQVEVAALHNEHRHWGKPLLAEVAGVDPTWVRALLKLHEDRLELGGPAIDVREQDEDVDEYVERPKVGAAVVPLADPVGVRTMKADLVQQVLAEADRDAEWLAI